MEILRKLRRLTTRQKGDAAERLAEQHLASAGLTLVTRNYRTPGRGGGEIDLIMREPDGTLVFIEVRQRDDARFGGAGGSIGQEKRKRLILAAQSYLLSQHSLPPPCRFDAVLLDGGNLQWIRGAFDVS